MICPDLETALNALVDGELDPPAAWALAAHVASCPGCATGLAGLLALHAELTALAPGEPASAALRQRIEAALPGGAAVTAVPDDMEATALPHQGSPGSSVHSIPKRSEAGRRARGPLAGFAAGLAAAAVLALAVFAAHRASHETASHETASHETASHETGTLTALAESVRRASLPAAVLAPSISAPTAAARWFAHHGLAVAPTPDLTTDGFRFALYRGDLVAGHRAAVLDYTRAGQPITLFAWPAGHGEPAHMPRTARTEGMTVIYWNNGKTEFWAVGTEKDAVAAFVAAYRRAA